MIPRRFQLHFAATCLLYSVCLLFSRSVRAEEPYFRILPAPRSLELTGTKGLAGRELTFVEAAADSVYPVFGPLLDGLPRSRRAGKGVYLRLSEQETPESPEGYRLEVTASGVTITARTQAGLFYGCQTLEQLLEDSRDFRKNIPAMKIVDYPAVPYRAVHFDTKHHLDRMEYYYREIDRLARYKINAVIWELEDKLRYTRRPEVASPNAISKQEMAALCRYARDRHIEIDPLVQGLGHASFILKHHWEVRENPASDWEFCPSDPRTYEIQFDLYRDALEALPGGKYLHIGGDEITAIGIDVRCRATGKSAFELQMHWLQQVCRFAVTHGRTPIFWDDMPLKYAGVWNLVNSDLSPTEIDRRWNSGKLDSSLALFPAECVYMRWNYSNAASAGNKKMVEWYNRKGLKVMGATAAAAGDSPFLPRDNSRIDQIRAFSRLIAGNRLEGILATAWDDGSPHAETVWRGFIAQAEYGWNPEGRSPGAFNDAHAQREFGFVPADSIMHFLPLLEKNAFFFDGALVTAGRRNPAWGTGAYTLIELPDPERPGAWAEKYAQKITGARLALQRYESIGAGLEKAQRNALRNRYTLRIYEQTNRLLAYPARLIDALGRFDTAEPDARRAALDSLYAVCCDFADLRRALESVYSETRFMEQPEGYLADLNHHNHLAAKTNTSDWWYWYELPMVEKTLRWLGKKPAGEEFRMF